MKMLWIFAMFGLMILGVMSYLFITGEFYDFPVFQQLASQLGVTQHELGIWVLMLFVFVIPFIIMPLIFLLVTVIRG